MTESCRRSKLKENNLEKINNVLGITNSWTFKTKEVATHFDEHVREQLPWYDNLTTLVTILAKHYLPEKAVAYDIGASTGNLGYALRDIIQERSIDWIGIDNAKSMQSEYRAQGKLIIGDAITYDYQPFNLAVCFLSLMFFPVEKRREWFLRLVSLVKTGGAIIVIDKEEPSGGIISTAMQRYLWKDKYDHGATPDDIVRKEMSLCGIQRPLPKDFFDGIKVYEFFRFGFFVGYIYINQEK